MTIAERLYQYMAAKHLTAYAVEQACHLSNGYLGKQLKNKGSFGSKVLTKIKKQYPDLNMLWLVNGKGKMLVELGYSPAETIKNELAEEQAAYYKAKDEVIELLMTQIRQLEAALADKEKLISLLEAKLSSRNN